MNGRTNSESKTIPECSGFRLSSLHSRQPATKQERVARKRKTEKEKRALSSLQCYIQQNR